jgi:hypothetical protein
MYLRYMNSKFQLCNFFFTIRCTITHNQVGLATIEMSNDLNRTREKMLFTNLGIIVVKESLIDGIKQPPKSKSYMILPSSINQSPAAKNQYNNNRHTCTCQIYTHELGWFYDAGIYRFIWSHHVFSLFQPIFLTQTWTEQKQLEKETWYSKIKQQLYS